MTGDLLQPMCPDCRENEDGSLTCDPALTLCLRHVSALLGVITPCYLGVMTQEPNAGQQLDGIMRDLNEATAAWAAAGHGYGTPEDEAREAVFARPREWNKRNAR